jgi:hypothetical protein
MKLSLVASGDSDWAEAGMLRTVARRHKRDLKNCMLDVRDA